MNAGNRRAMRLFRARHARRRITSQAPGIRPGTEVNAPSAFPTVDALASAIFGRTRADALEEGVCIRCGQTPEIDDPRDLAEFLISATCPACFDEITEPDE